jgi:lipopolysaccharide/colanic/teichoic acid biosynthesis glycosyltransferase
MNAEGERVKRAIDIAGAAAGLALAAPILAIAACAIKLEDDGPVFFRQMRLGRGERPFEVLKLRTMTVDAETVRSDGVVEEGDPRITRVGSLLRRTAVDELPQLWNVLRGEMSLVGPRPVPLPHLERYDERQRRRLEVRPGVTGWAQIHGRASLPWPERIELDVWYVEHRSLAVDARILARTAGVLLRRDVVYRGEAGGWR